ncbi:hypothetical protein ATANTOWER_020588 [Ataeniobius toweri]|uniref:Secreted protein n=1 Tax=Ataeniobius toweri TaxID=208326 RepID=A0ABU7CKZ1_9TELE|nr:hypothetical protein [Ataeniobius toweri]
MLPALRHLSVLPLWFSFGPSSSSFESTYLTSPSLPIFPVRLCWQPLDSILSASPSETCPPSSEQHLWTPSVRKHRIKVLIRGKDQLIKVTRPTKLTRPGITFLRREVPVPDPTFIGPVIK